MVAVATSGSTLGNLILIPACLTLDERRRALDERRRRPNVPPATPRPSSVLAP
jgi:hypothetical protein